MEEIDEKTLEEKETEFLEIEKKRREQEKIKKQKEKLLEQLRIKQEEKKNLEKKLKEKKIRELNKKTNKENKSINDKNDNKNILSETENNKEENSNNDENNMNNVHINNTYLNKKENKNNMNNIYNINNIKSKNENSKEGNVVNEINNKNFDSFRNFNDLNSKDINNQQILNNSNNNIDYNKRPSIEQEIDKNHLKPEYLIDSNTFDEIQKNKMNNNNNIINKNNQNIEPKKILSERENQNIKILKNLINFGGKKEKKTKKLNKKPVNNNIQINNYNTYKNPIELTLYNDAIKRRKKLENIDNNIKKGIKLNSNKTKITNASYKVAIEREEKIIEQIINNHSILQKNNIKCINIIGIALSLKDMKIFRELFKEKNNNNIHTNNIKNNNKDYTISDLKKIISSVNIKEARKIKEINFLIQTWLLLNPEQNEYINKDIFIGLLKIIFDPEGTLKEIESLLKKYLDAALIGGLISKKFLLENKNIINNNNILCYPLSNKKINIKDLWPLIKYIKTFFELKKNLIAYKTTTSNSGDKYSNLKHQKIQSNINNTNLTLENEKNIEKNKKQFNFDKLYKNFLEKEQNKKNNIEQMRKKKEQDELKELKQKPTITKYKLNTITENEYYINGKKKENIYDRLYKLDKKRRAKKLELIKEKEKNEKEQFDLQIKKAKFSINTRLNEQRMNKSFDQPYKCRGYDQYVKRNRKGRLERLRVKYLLEKSPAGEKYEEIMRRNITPPNITDIRKMKKKEYYKTIDYAYRNSKDKKDVIKPEEFSDNESDGNTEYFNLQIKLPNSKIQTLKIYENDDANQVVEEFCKIHSVDENIKNKLVANIENCQKQFLNKDIKNDNKGNQENEEEEEEIEEENNIINENSQNNK